MGHAQALRRGLKGRLGVWPVLAGRSATSNFSLLPGLLVSHAGNPPGSPSRPSSCRVRGSPSPAAPLRRIDVRVSGGASAGRPSSFSRPQRPPTSHDRLRDAATSESLREIIGGASSTSSRPPMQLLGGLAYSPRMPAAPAAIPSRAAPPLHLRPRRGEPPRPRPVAMLAVVAVRRSGRSALPATQPRSSDTPSSRWRRWT